MPVGSEFGLFRYDGKVSRPFTTEPVPSLSFANISTGFLAEDNFRHLWVGSQDAGIMLINLDNDSVTAFVQHNSSNLHIP